jgi:hypothetical protein
MPDAVTRPSDQLSFRRFPLVAMIAAGIAGLLVAATVALWVHFGSAVFYEMVLAGFAACF